MGVGIVSGPDVQEQRILRGHVQVEHSTTCANKGLDKETRPCALQGVSLRDLFLLLALDQNTFPPFLRI